MGIDARILLRSQVQLFDEDLRKMSYMLGSTVGPEKLHFPDYAWEGDKMVKRANQVAIRPCDGNIWEQDGAPIHPAEGEFFYEVLLQSRYYGPGYERGDWSGIRSIIEFFKYNYPNSIDVWYGGDSSGVCAERMDREALEVINRHFYLQGQRPYLGAFGGFRGESSMICPRCHGPCSDHGGSSEVTFFICHGCGDRFTRPVGGIVATKVGKDWKEKPSNA